MVKVAPAFRVRGVVGGFVSRKSAPCVPANAMPVICTELVPLLVTVKDWDGLFVPLTALKINSDVDATTAAWLTLTPKVIKLSIKTKIKIGIKLRFKG